MVSTRGRKVGKGGLRVKVKLQKRRELLLLAMGYCVPLKKYVEMLRPSISEYDCIWKSVIANIIS